MQDIVEQLRVYQASIACPDGDLIVGPAMCANAFSEAAAEIERLRGALKKIANTKNNIARSSIREYAASVLQPTK